VAFVKGEQGTVANQTANFRPQRGAINGLLAYVFEHPLTDPLFALSRLDAGFPHAELVANGKDANQLEKRMDEISKLVAIEDIRAMKARYFRLLDDKQWADYAILFTDDAVMDLSQVLPAGTPVEKLSLTGPDSIVAQTRDLLSDAIMIHNGYTHEINVISPDEATGVWAMEDRVIFPAGVASPFPFRRSHNFGRYYEEYRKVEGSWKIARLRLIRLWQDFS